MKLIAHAYVCFSVAASQPLDLSPLLGVIARIEAGQQALTAEVRALSAQAQSPSRAQDGERAWQLCPDQSEGLPAAVVAVALQRAAERGARVPAELAERALIPLSELQAMRASLPKASWELELIVLVTPYLRAVISLPRRVGLRGHPGAGPRVGRAPGRRARGPPRGRPRAPARLQRPDRVLRRVGRRAGGVERVLVNSEVFAWIQKALDNRRLRQKPQAVAEA